MPVFCLSPHAHYACGRSGVCCSSGWAIPVDTRLRAVVGTELLVPRADGTCVHYQRDHRACGLQQAHGETALPTSCHEFPRITLRDPRGVFVTLSHYCPTAARALVEFDGPLVIVTNPAAFPDARGYDALEASTAWPPLVRPDLLFDLDAYSAWEHLVTACLDRVDAGVWATLDRLDALAEVVRAWKPGHASLTTHITEAGASALQQPVHHDRRDVWADVDVSVDLVRATVLSGLPMPGPTVGLREAWKGLVEPYWDAFARPIGRYLACKTVGSWTAYQGRGLRTTLAEVRLAAHVLAAEATRACAREARILDTAVLIDAVRAADLILVHHVDRDRLVRACARTER